MAGDTFIDEIFTEFESEDFKKKIKSFVVKPIIAMIYNDLFPYICFFTSILVLCIFLLLFVVFFLTFSR